MYFVYKLIDPVTNKIHYIGKTTQPINKRLEGHINESDRYGNLPIATAKQKWIYNLRNKNLVPKIEVLETCYDEKSLDVAEKFWIKAYTSGDKENILLNIVLNPNKNKTIELFENQIYKPHIVQELYELLLIRKLPIDTLYDLYLDELISIYNLLLMMFSDAGFNTKKLKTSLNLVCKKYSIMLYILGNGKKISYNKLKVQYDNWERSIRYQGKDFIKHINSIKKIDRIDIFFNQRIKLSDTRLLSKGLPDT
jgi:hypothetical protein